MGRGLSDLQKAALTLAVTLDPQHKKNKWQRGVIDEEKAAERNNQLKAFLGKEGDCVPDPENVTTYHLEPWELIDNYYCQQCYPSNAQQVAVSKALRRLVDRGLMFKLDKRGTTYGNRFNLTDEGLAKASQLLTNG